MATFYDLVSYEDDVYSDTLNIDPLFVGTYACTISVTDDGLSHGAS